jgi:hypothetical protein
VEVVDEDEPRDDGIETKQRQLDVQHRQPRPCLLKQLLVRGREDDDGDVEGEQQKREVVLRCAPTDMNLGIPAACSVTK